MLTYVSKNQQHAEVARESLWLLMLLVFAWLWPGVFSHDLWSPHELIVYAIIDETTAFFIPTLLGEPYFQVAPIYVWVAQWLRYWFAPWATDVYSAARFATVLFTALGLVGSGMAAYRLLGKSYGRTTVLILIGSVGLLEIGHFLGGMSVAFAGVGLALWGISVAQRQVVFAALLLGIGGVLLGQSLGWLFAGCLLLVAMLLACTKTWRGVRYVTVLLGAWVLMLSWAILQYLMMMQVNVAVANEYWQYYFFGAYGGVGHIQTQWNGWYYLRHLSWFAFPAYPLAIWTLWRYRDGGWQAGGVVLCLVWIMVFMAFLVVNPQHYQDNLIVVLPAVAILGAAQLDYLRRGVAAFLNWFGMMLFGLLAIFLWIGFVAMNYGVPARLAARAVYFSPFYARDIDVMPMVVAVVFSIAWIIAITRKRIRGRQSVSNWASGMTLAWGLLLSLFLPWLDAAKSHRPVVQQMNSRLPDATLVNCLYIAPDHVVARLAWKQYGTLPTVSDASGQHCAYELVQYQQPVDLNHVASERIVWKGKRPRQKTELFALIKR